MKKCVIDIGSNSVRWLIGEPGRIEAEGVRVTQLGRDFPKTGMMGSGCVNDTIELLKEIHNNAKTAGCEKITAAGTQIFRAASNAGDVVREIKDRTGIEVRILSSDEEARIACAGASSALDRRDGSFTVVDVGGGSSQLTRAEADKITGSISFPLGALTITERYGIMKNGKMAAEALHAAREEVDTLINSAHVRQFWKVPVVVCGGTASACVWMKKGLARFDGTVIHGAHISSKDVEDVIKLFDDNPIETLRVRHGIDIPRLSILPGGLLILSRIIECLEPPSCVVSRHGLSYGMFI